MNNIKLIALDLDKTLLKNHITLHPKNVNAVKKVQALGTKVIIATGRSPQASYKFAKELGLYENNGFIVCFNGAYVMELKTGEVLINKELNLTIIQQIVTLAKKHKVSFWGYSVDGQIGYILKRTFKIWIIQKLNKRKIVKVNENSEVRMYKILLLGRSKRIDKLLAALEPLNIVELAVSTKKRVKVVEINELNVNKASGVKFLAKMWNIKREEVMAIGDSMNDYALINWAGYGIAMANSDKALLEVANDVTSSYADGGVSKALHKYILDAS